MKKNIYLIGGSFVTAVVLTLVVMVLVAPSLMINEYQSRYDFNETVSVFEERVADAGWGVLNVHNMQEVKANLGYEVLPVMIFDLCSGQYSYQILSRDDERIVTPLMPCRVSIYEKSDGNTYIAMLNSGLVARVFGGVINDVMQQVMLETAAIIEPMTA